MSGQKLSFGDFFGDSRPRSGAPPREPCLFFFKRGSCKFGNDCRLSHDPSDYNQYNDNPRGDYSKRDDRDYPPSRRDDYPPQRRDDYPPQRRDDYSSRSYNPPPSRGFREDYPPSRGFRDDYPPSRRDDYAPPRREDSHPPREYRDDHYGPPRGYRDDYPPRRDEHSSRYKDDHPSSSSRESYAPPRNGKDDHPPPKATVKSTSKDAPPPKQEIGGLSKKDEPARKGVNDGPSFRPGQPKDSKQPPQDKKKDNFPPSKKDSDFYLGPSKPSRPARRIERGRVDSIRGMSGKIKLSGGELIYFHSSSTVDGITLREREDVECEIIEDRFGLSAINVKSLGVVSILNEDKKAAEKQQQDELSAFRPAWMSSSAASSLPPSASSLSHSQDDHEHDEHTEGSLSKRKMLDWIKTIDEGDPETLIMHIDFLEQVLNSDEMPFTVIQPLVLILTRDEVLESERTDKIYYAVLESKFLRNPRNLRSYILKLSSTKAPTSEEAHSFERVLALLQELMDRCRTYHDIPLDALDPSRCAAYPPSVASRIEKLTKLAADIRTQSTQSMINTNWAPQEEDFRDMPIFPTTEEILGVKSGELSPNLRANVVDGRFDNVMHYLDTHFRLLREDCLQPLREGIQAYRNKSDTRDVRVYTNVRVCGIMCARTGLIYRVSFETDRPVAWSQSKRLIYGSLLCLSPDRFNTLLWATVSQRDDALLAKQQIDIQFPAGYEARFDSSVAYTMAESVTTYFEAYQHVLRALQQLDLDRFPFKDYLISCQAAVQPPLYMRGGSGADRFNLCSVLDGGRTTFPVLGTWPEVETTMDASQLLAFKQALTKEFAIIQGPPGTGKTFVGLKVMRALLDNRHLRRKGPILVVCCTNHALDQFLEGIMEFEENIVRIGSRSKSDRLKEKNIRQLIHDTLKWGQQHKARKAISVQLDLLQKDITERVADLNRKEISVEDIQQFISEEQFDSLISRDGVRRRYHPSIPELTDILRHWLGDDPRRVLSAEAQPAKNKQKAGPLPITKQNGKQKSFGSLPKMEVKNWAEDGDAEEEVDDETRTNLQQERMVGDEDVAGPSGEGVVEFRGTLADLHTSGALPQSIRECEDVWELKIAERRKLYKYWAGLSMRRSEEPLTQLSAQYDRLCRERTNLEDALKVEVLANSAVIGMTTTGVAKFHNLLQAVQPEIIIVEEAAEVLEAHIVVALSQATKHVILIGDHEQLRPSTAVYQLSTKFHLDVSLFERMVRNNVEQVTLLRQRRMRPDISKLIMPLYPKLENHTYVTTYPDVMGVASNVYLVSHNVDEEKDSDSGSKSNIHEVLFLTRMCEYLLLQGYKPEQITVLTPYCGQVRLLHKEFRKASTADVRITSVDNFQGEEADIILLSLVRSNPQGEIGFLNVSNRVCVALSRAKIGFYMIGNTNMLKRNKLWIAVLDILESKKMVGPALALRCQNHPKTTTYVKTETDFKQVSDGGCHLPCKAMMTCGHMCPRLCHPYPHDKLMCQSPCTKTHSECGHPCERRCYEDCGLCLVLVERDLPCGHTVRAACAESRENIKCTEPCERRLPCRHPCPKTCGEKCPRQCAVKVERDLPCGHTVPVPCSEDIRKFKCPTQCLAYLPCGHKCTGTCGECSRMKSKHIPCVECAGGGGPSE